MAKKLNAALASGARSPIRSIQPSGALGARSPHLTVEGAMLDTGDGDAAHTAGRRGRGVSALREIPGSQGS